MNRLLTIAGPALFISAIAAYWLLGPSATVRVVAVSLVLSGANTVFTREVPVGWEGRPPSFHLRGPVAFAIGAVAIAAGIAMVLFAPSVACAIGWARECSTSAT
jgi:hypothetical protein